MYNSGDCQTNYNSNLDCGYNPSKGANGCNGAWLSAYPKFIAGNKSLMTSESFICVMQPITYL